MDEAEREKIVISNPTNFQHVYHVGGKEVPTRSLRRRETVRNNDTDDVPVFLGASYKPPALTVALPVYNGKITVPRPATSQALRRRDPSSVTLGSNSTSLPERTADDAPLPDVPLPHKPLPMPQSLMIPARANATRPPEVDSTHLPAEDDALPYVPLPEAPLPLPQSMCIPARKPSEPRRTDHTAEAATLPAPPLPDQALPLPQSFYAPLRKLSGEVSLSSDVAASDAVPPLPTLPLPHQPLPTPESARLASAEQGSADDADDDGEVPLAPPMPQAPLPLAQSIAIRKASVPARVESPPAIAIAIAAPAQHVPSPPTQATAPPRPKSQPPSRPLSQPPLLVINSTQNLNAPPVVPLRRPGSPAPEIRVELSVVAPPADARRTPSPGPQRPPPAHAPPAVPPSRSLSPAPARASLLPIATPAQKLAPSHAPVAAPSLSPNVHRDPSPAPQHASHNTPTLGVATLLKPTTRPSAPAAGWVDSNFPANSTVLAVATNPSTVVWRRPRDLHPNATLWVDGCDPGDVIQGKLGDCWILGALLVIATLPSMCMRLIRPDPRCPGKYIVRLWSFGQWIEIEIDDQIPCVKSADDVTYRPVYSRCLVPDEFWVPLMEKGVAKFLGSYARMQGGSVHTGMGLLSGGLPGKIQFKEVGRVNISSGQFWDYMIGNSTQCLMACAWGKEGGAEERNGLLQGHAYGILEFRAVRGHRLIRLRNPWGEKEWNGAWSDHAPQWTPELCAMLGQVAKDDGTFWMCYEDFCRNFDRLYTCRIVDDEDKKSVMGEWRGPSAAGCLNTPRWRHGPQHLLTVAQSGWTYVTMEQDARVTPLTHIGFVVVKLPSGKKERLFRIDESQVIAEVVHTDSSAVNIELYLEAGLYALLPQTYDVGVERKFVLTVAGAASLRLGDLGNRNFGYAKAQGEWKGRSSGGCKNYETWTDNPKFILRGEGVVTVVLEQPKRDALEPIGFYVYPFLPNRDLTDLDIICKSEFTESVESSHVVTLKPSEPVVVVACLFDAGKEGTLTLHAYTDSGRLTMQSAI